MQILQSMLEFELFFADMISDYTGLNSDRVLVMYNEDGQVSFDINVDAAYVHVRPTNDIRLQFKNRVTEYNSNEDNFTISQQSMRTLELQIVFYGPNGEKYAQLFSEYMHTEEARIALKKEYLSLVAEMQNGPNHTHELSSGRWYQRTDLVLCFYNTIQIEETVERITSANIEIVNDIKGGNE